MSVITAIPWNGYKAAASFTFDDASESHITNLFPLAEKLGIKVTCFLTGDSWYFRNNYGKFLQMAQAGHEMGNHTETHPKLTQLSDDDRRREILDYKKFLKKQMPDLPFNVFGTPYCDNNEEVQAIIGQEHYISRDCRGYGRITWDKEINWLSMDSKAWQRSLNTVDEFRQIARDTEAAGEWIIYMNHGVDEDQNNDYSINPSDLQEIMQQAIDLDMWIAPFGVVGAYHRAAFALKKATAKESDDGLSIQWKSPHSRMPSSISMKVRLNVDGNSKVFQKGNEIQQNSDGSYTIEFMDQALEIIL
ncbi:MULTISPECIES: polysaccharide deacetylase family protein [unclassified Fibrobacter]|uniref:polysaccharide deacetylase family protein n=1 Tax=unclassified Fibrobacter TaxID=2634177 RepID=UPI000D7B602A|nr:MULTISPECIES: polysaccharide deacetylase family protein [unclassified Fibrobacter]PWJ58608.1 polysaccharide deacetylase [Fibrobacter sp. UWR4]PZW62850.1 polysaccharide deacetylase [Fibrobacter sp. UWR1]